MLSKSHKLKAIIKAVVYLLANVYEKNVSKFSKQCPIYACISYKTDYKTTLDKKWHYKYQQLNNPR